MSACLESVDRQVFLQLNLTLADPCGISSFCDQITLETFYKMLHIAQTDLGDTEWENMWRHSPIFKQIKESVQEDWHFPRLNNQDNWIR